jgi:hypothetical protein
MKSQDSMSRWEIAGRFVAIIANLLQGGQIDGEM